MRDVTPFNLPSTPYFLSHSVGCLPKTADAFIEQAFLSPWKRSGGDAWGPWLGIIDDFCCSLANLLGAEPADICPQTNLSSSFTKFLMSLPKTDSKRNKVVMDKNAFPSMGFVANGLASLGYELVLVESAQNENELPAWQSCLDNTTLCVLITHVHSNTGYVSDVTAIADLAGANGAYAVVDVAQSVGVLPIDVTRWHASAVIGSCVKWLCGGPGAGFIWINSDIVNRLQPVDVGWFSHQNPFEMNITDFRYADGAKRFWGGTPNVAPYAIALNSINIIKNMGVETVYKHNRKMLKLVHSAFENILVAPIDLNRNGGTLCLELPQKILANVCQKLDENKAFYDTRGDTIRLSLHIYNDETDVALLTSLLSE